MKSENTNPRLSVNMYSQPSGFMSPLRAEVRGNDNYYYTRRQEHFHCLLPGLVLGLARDCLRLD